MTICDDCKWNMSEEITDVLYEHYCNEDSPNYLTEDGCYHFDQREDDRE